LYTLRSANYICHFSIFKKELMTKLGGFRSEYDGSQDFDIVLRAAENTNKIVHIPKVLYHWRVHQNSTAGNADSKPYAYEVAKNVIKDHLSRNNISAEVTDGATYGSYKVQYKVKTEELITIIIDIDNIQKIDRILKIINDSTYKNKEIIIINNNYKQDNILTITPQTTKEASYNEAVSKSKGKYFIILDENLVYVNCNDWLEQLLGVCQNEDVGVVGTKIFNENELVENAGIILDEENIANFINRGIPKYYDTYMQRLKIIHNVSSVICKYALIKKEIFNKNNKFTNQYSEILASIDFCLRTLNNNKQVILNPIVEFCVEKLDGMQKKDNEVTIFKNEWKNNLQKDIYYNLNLECDSNSTIKKNKVED